MFAPQVMGGGGSVAYETIDELLAADIRQGADGKDRNEAPLAYRLNKLLRDFLWTDFFSLEITLHQIVIGLNDGLHEIIGVTESVFHRGETCAGFVR